MLEYAKQLGLELDAAKIQYCRNLCDSLVTSQDHGETWEHPVQNEQEARRLGAQLLRGFNVDESGEFAARHLLSMDGRVVIAQYGNGAEPSELRYLIEELELVGKPPERMWLNGAEYYAPVKKYPRRGELSPDPPTWTQQRKALNQRLRRKF